MILLPFPPKFSIQMQMLHLLLCCCCVTRMRFDSFRWKNVDFRQTKNVHLNFTFFFPFQKLFLITIYDFEQRLGVARSASVSIKKKTGHLFYDSMQRRRAISMGKLMHTSQMNAKHKWINVYQISHHAQQRLTFEMVGVSLASAPIRV